MPGRHVAQIGTSSGLNQSSITVTAPVPVGDYVIVFWFDWTADTSAVTDSKGNTWQNANTLTHLLRKSGISYSKLTTALVPGDQITLNGSVGPFAIVAAHFADLETVSAFDKTARQAGTSLAIDSGPTAVLAQADELAVGLAGYWAGYDAATVPSLAASGWMVGSWAYFNSAIYGSIGVGYAYKTVEATDALSFAGTISGPASASSAHAIAATYKADDEPPGGIAVGGVSGSVSHGGGGTSVSGVTCVISHWEYEEPLSSGATLDALPTDTSVIPCDPNAA